MSKAGEKRERGKETLHIRLPAGRYYACGDQVRLEKESEKAGERGIGLDKHPIESLMATSMESIREMVDVNTVVRDT